MKLAPCSANTTHRTVKYLGFPYCCICRICCFRWCNSGRTKCILGTFLLYLSYQSLAVVSISKNGVVSRPFPVVSVVGDRIISISDNTLYLVSVVLGGCVLGFHMVVSVVRIFLIRQKRQIQLYMETRLNDQINVQQ